MLIKYVIGSIVIFAICDYFQLSCSLHNSTGGSVTQNMAKDSDRERKLGGRWQKDRQKTTEVVLDNKNAHTCTGLCYF